MTLYRGTTYIGYVAVLNGVKRGKFSLSWNQRNSKNATHKTPIERLADWATGKNNGTPMALVSRQLFEGPKPTVDSFQKAKMFLATVPLIR